MAARAHSICFTIIIIWIVAINRIHFISSIHNFLLLCLSLMKGKCTIESPFSVISICIYIHFINSHSLWSWQVYCIFKNQYTSTLIISNIIKYFYLHPLTSYASSASFSGELWSRMTPSLEPNIFVTEGLVISQLFAEFSSIKSG